MVMNVFALCGQSNMSGATSVPIYQTINKNIFNWQDEKWIPASESIHNNGYAGPALSFAIALSMLKGGDYQIGLVPCAIPGSRIIEWQRGQSIYENAVSKVNTALSTQSTNLSGVLFSQGESDTFSVVDADAWKDLALQFARDFRTDTGLLTVPFLYAQLGANPNDPNRVAWDYLRDIIQPTLCDPARAYVRMIRTLDIPNKSQHFADYDAYSIVGRRFAARYFCDFAS